MLIENGKMEAIATADQPPPPDTVLVITGQTYWVHFSQQDGDDSWVYVSRYSGPLP
jgi:hypothetical protein